MAHTRQSKPDSGLGVQVKGLVARTVEDMAAPEPHNLLLQRHWVVGVRDLVRTLSQTMH